MRWKAFHPEVRRGVRPVFADVSADLDVTGF
jgi:hypothetical protein